MSMTTMCVTVVVIKMLTTMLLLSKDVILRSVLKKQVCQIERIVIMVLLNSIVYPNIECFLYKFKRLFRFITF